MLGLTFTTKATAELAARVREALAAAGLDEPVAGAPGSPTSCPSGSSRWWSTYNAYAAALLTEHGLRIGHEPDTRVMADASRYQVAARAIERHTGAVELLSEHPKTAIDYLLALDGELNEHLVAIDQVRAFQAPQRPRVRGGPGHVEGQGRHHQGARQDERARGDPRPRRGLPPRSRRSSG